MAKSAPKRVDKTQEELLLKNHERVGRGLIFLAQGLQPFVEGQMQKFHGDNWEEVAKECLGDKDFHIESESHQSRGFPSANSDDYQPTARGV